MYFCAGILPFILNLKENTETELIRRLKKGDVDAFTQIYNLYFKRLYHYSLEFTKSVHQAEDIVQDVFAKLWTNRSSLSADKQLQSLLFVMTKNHLISAYRKNINSPIYEDYIDYCNIVYHYDHSRIEYEEFIGHVRKVISELPKSQQNVVIMSKIQQMSNREIAEALGINEQSVKNYLTQALRLVRDKLRHLLLILALLIFS